MAAPRIARSTLARVSPTDGVRVHPNRSTRQPQDTSPNGAAQVVSIATRPIAAPTLRRRGSGSREGMAHVVS